MRYPSLIVGSFLLVMLVWVAASAEARTLGRGYSETDHRTLTQTYLSLLPRESVTSNMLTAYAKMTHCPIYRRDFNDDFKWAAFEQKLRSNLSRHSRTLQRHYEIKTPVFLGRYDFESERFPLVNGSAKENIGRLVLFSPSSYQNYCTHTADSSLPESYEMILFEPLNVQTMKISADMAQNVMQHIELSSSGYRVVYARYRFEIHEISQTQQKTFDHKGIFIGHARGVDFFIDKNYTRKISSIQYLDHQP